MSHEQKRMWFNHKVNLENGNGEANVYNLLLVMELNGALDICNFIKAFQLIICRHEIFRTAFDVINNVPSQIIYDTYEHIDEEKDIYIPVLHEKIEEFLLSMYQIKFNLSELPLYKFRLVKISENQHIFAFLIHHIIFDGHSADLLFYELFGAYGELCHSGQAFIEPPAIQYCDYSQWKLQELKKQEDVLHKFWINHLGEPIPETQFPSCYRYEKSHSSNCDYIEINIADSLYTELVKYCGLKRISLYQFMLSCFVGALSFYTQSEDVVLGATFLGRTHRDTMDMIGCFVNTMPLRFHLQSNGYFSKHLEDCCHIIKQTMSNQFYPFDMLVEQLNIERDLNKNPLFSIVFQLSNWIIDKKILDTDEKVESLNIKSVDFKPKYCAFDISLELFNRNYKIDGFLQYSSELFDRSTMERFIVSYLSFVQQVITQPDIKMEMLDLVSKADRELQLNKINRFTPHLYSLTTILDEYQEHVRLHPDAIACHYRTEQITYKEFDILTNKMANYFYSCGIGPSCIVVLRMNYGIDLVVAIMAVLKTGAAYIPVEWDSPKEQLTKIITSSCAYALVTNISEFEENYANCHVLKTTDILFESQCDEFISRATLDSLAYIIYTSGSTGEPKGVMVSHKNLINYIQWAKETYIKSNHEGFALFSSIACDMTVTSIFTPLISCGYVKIFTDDENEYVLTRIVKDPDVTVLKATPSHLTMIKGLNNTSSSIHTIISGGEDLLCSLARDITNSFGKSIKIYNEYGPTETTVGCMIHLYNPQEDILGSVPIGLPIRNNLVFVLDKNRNLLPCGAIGELYIGGIQVTNGYISNEPLTMESFIQDKVLCTGTLYKTGDLAVVSERGLLYKGRRDQQVKIKGYRIELSEVNNHILQNYPGVRQVCTLVRKGNLYEDILVTYYSGELNNEQGEIKQQLRQIMPNYMIPSFFVHLDKMPLLSNGKINLKKLETMSLFNSLERIVTEEILSPTEQLVASAWEKGLVHTIKISKNDNFFSIGGHSILAVQVINHLRETLQVDIALRDIFNNPVLKDFSSRIDELLAQEKKFAYSDIRHIEKEKYELAPVQKPEWYLNQLLSDSSFYNASTYFLFEGDMNIDAFNNAVWHLFQQNRLFRVKFMIENGIPYQTIRAKESIIQQNIYQKYYVPDGMDENEFIRQIIAQLTNVIFDLTKDILFKFHLVEFKPKNYLFIFVTHHIIWDELSALHMLEQLASLYNNIKNKAELVTDSGVIDYFDYIEWINQAIYNGKFENDRKYWLDKYVHNMPPILDIHTDYQRPAMQTFDGDAVYYDISDAMRDQIMNYCFKNSVTTNHFFVSVLFLLHHLLTNGDDLVIGTPMTNRDDSKLEHVLGLFSSGIPLRCRIDKDMLFSEHLENMKREIVETYDHHIYPFNYILEEIPLANDASRSKLFTIMFGLQSEKDTLKNKMHFEGLQTSFKSLEYIETTARFDLTMAIETVNGFQISVNFNTNLYKKITAELYIQRYVKLISDVLRDDKLHIRAYNLLLDYDYIVIKNACMGEKLILNFETILTRFKDNVLSKPNNIAITEGNHSITYSDLYKASQEVAVALIEEYNVNSGSNVGIKMEPGINFITAVLAVLHAGAAFIPIETDYPVNRIEDIAMQVNFTLIITDNAEELYRGTESRSFHTLAARNKGIATSYYNRAHPDSLAYIIFTSGSTGKPKGIEVKHLGVVNLFTWTETKYPLSENEMSLFITPPSFDVSILDYLYPLFVGARVYVLSKDDRGNPQKIGRAVAMANVAIVQFVPDLLTAFIDSYENHEFEQSKSLKYVICAGGVLTKKLVDLFKSHFSCQLSNHYGPTEATVDSTFFECCESFEGDNVPIGRPIANTNVYILDQWNRQAAVGVEGEICIESIGLARGYINQPTQTEKQFIEWMSPEGIEVKLYKTGDLGYVSHMGVLMFSGRKDNQVKIRGNRVELEEIENIVHRLPEVKSSAAILANNQLALAIELKKTNQIPTKHGAVYIYNLKQLPAMIENVQAINHQAWPAYFQYNEANNLYWPQLFAYFLDFQIVLIDEANQVIGAGHTIPIKWSGTENDIPYGWDGGIKQGIMTDRHEADTLLVLSGIISDSEQGKGYSKTILQSFQFLAAAHGLKRILVPVRPTKKYLYPLMEIKEYCAMTQEDGKLFDPWLSVHVSMGGRILKYESQSQKVVAPINKWSEWMDKKILEAQGLYNKCLSPIIFDHQNNIGIYFDPCVWVEHSIPNKILNTLSLTDASKVKGFLSDFLPKYMIPDKIEIFHRLPKLTNEKIDKKKLETQLSQVLKSDLVVPEDELEKNIYALWTQLFFDKFEFGVTDDFYEIGGHSLLATVLIHRINERFHVNIMLKDFNMQPTIRATAIKVKELQGNFLCDNKSVAKIKPIHYINNDCFEDQMCSLLYWMKLNDQHLFLDSWGFQWVPQSGKSLADQIYPGSDVNNILATAKHIYSVETIISDYETIEKALLAIKQSLSNKQPIIVADDSYHCSWDNNFQKKHDNHCSIITGYIHEKSAFICTDGYNSMYNIEYPISDFIKGFQRKCFNLVKTGQVLPREEIIKYFLKNLKQRNKEQDIFRGMRAFAKEITEVDWEIQKDSSIIQHCEIYKKFYDIKRKRLQLDEWFTFVRIYEVDSGKTEFKMVCNCWQDILNILVKLLVNPGSKKSKLALQEKLFQAADLEEQVYLEIMELISI